MKTQSRPPVSPRALRTSALLALASLVALATPAAVAQSQHFCTFVSHPWLLATPANLPQWSDARSRSGSIGLFIDRIDDMMPAQRTQLVAMGKKFTIEMAGVLDGTVLTVVGGENQAAENSFNIEKAKLEPLLDAGGKIAFLFFDDPLRRMRYPFDGKLKADGGLYDPGMTGPRHSFTKAAEEVVEAVLLWRNYFANRYPDPADRPKIILGTNFANWGWTTASGGYAYRRPPVPRTPAPTPCAPNNEPLTYVTADDKGYGDYYTALHELRLEMNRNGGTAAQQLDGIIADYPYDYFAGLAGKRAFIAGVPNSHWARRLADLERVCRATSQTVGGTTFAYEKALQFYLIVNSERGGGSNPGGATFRADVMSYLSSYVTTPPLTGSYVPDPNGFWIESWYDHFPRKPNAYTLRTDDPCDSRYSPDLQPTDCLPETTASKFMEILRAAMNYVRDNY